ncbi:Uncharacterized protein family UPF0497 [Macleaya cordata]|uniref:CASP-like protein n=1 Tax=Macleaya cordata TaxID=56857 RepID=A0A200QN20_MACCD|nr:Uncharacterized protein family UPF0497 [Macleaya cordata]
MEKSSGSIGGGAISHGGSRLGDQSCGREDKSVHMGSVRMTSSAESLFRVVPMVLCVTALVVMLKNAMSNDYGSVSSSDLGGFKYLIYANGICAGYSLLSALYLAAVRPPSSSSTTTTTMYSQQTAWTVFFFDQVMTYIILAAGTVSAEVVYLAYKGDEAITWSEACGVFGGFCRKATVSVGITFAAVVCYVLLSLISSYRLFSSYDAPISSSSYPAKQGDHEIGAGFH